MLTAVQSLLSSCPHMYKLIAHPSINAGWVNLPQAVQTERRVDISRNAIDNQSTDVAEILYWI